MRMTCSRIGREGESSSSIRGSRRLTGTTAGRNGEDADDGGTCEMPSVEGGEFGQWHGREGFRPQSLFVDEDLFADATWKLAFGPTRGTKAKVELQSATTGFARAKVLIWPWRAFGLRNGKPITQGLLLWWRISGWHVVSARRHRRFAGNRLGLIRIEVEVDIVIRGLCRAILFNARAAKELAALDDASAIGKRTIARRTGICSWAVRGAHVMVLLGKGLRQNMTDILQIVKM